MGLIKKFDKFISEKLVADLPITKPVSKPAEDLELTKEEAAQKVIDRFSNIYRELPSEEKKKIDKYFQ
jgi:hypothetical protein